MENFHDSCACIFYKDIVGMFSEMPGMGNYFQFQYQRPLESPKELIVNHDWSSFFLYIDQHKIQIKSVAHYLTFKNAFFESRPPVCLLRKSYSF